MKLAENFNGADLRNVCTEAGMFAIRDERDYVVHEVRTSASSCSCCRPFGEPGHLTSLANFYQFESRCGVAVMHGSD